MCEFISWIELDGKNYFLTKKELATKDGRMLKKYLGSQYAVDVVGHGAINRYYHLDGRGIHRECIDFSSPDNFPPEIVKAIKKGLFKGMGVCPQILTQPAMAEYEKIQQQAMAEYRKIEQPAWAEYRKIQQQAMAEYEKIEQPAWAEYRKIEQQAMAEYRKITQQAWAEYRKIEQPAWAEYRKIEQQAFWKLAVNPDNRVDGWK